MANLSIGEVAQRTGLAVSAIRYYEDMGLVHPDRTAGGRRTFARSDIRRLSFVMISQRLGFSIAEIREAMSHLPEGRTPTRSDWTRLSRGFRHHLDARIQGLTELRDRLDGCIGCGCLSLRQCKLYNQGDIAGGKGAGPRYVLGDAPADEGY
ncbi:redox-sensitive transcriptional activator SoxR [Puniceibacterium sp. IMCC21224]|uniref:redox-sensitive transcriptional activator SoxR n=1 Tax=Puniceibacterium sp. IMCC21224 TaxID=1618204 RepID=UPI00064D87F0|nr:redox-sensitive transcriptional activator SoxR [Puniceibacterium sp. IMCC21224]KMK66687.1 redox-sensitive transcriptional activator SoxR [Puniceibacterium sp. IMCC21224]